MAYLQPNPWVFVFCYFWVWLGPSWKPLLYNLLKERVEGLSLRNSEGVGVGLEGVGVEHSSWGGGVCHQKKWNKSTWMSPHNLNWFHFLVMFSVHCKDEIFQDWLLEKPKELGLCMKFSEKKTTHTHTLTHTKKGKGDFYPKVIVNPKQAFILHSEIRRKEKKNHEYQHLSYKDCHGPVEVRKIICKWLPPLFFFLLWWPCALPKLILKRKST